MNYSHHPATMLAMPINPRTPHCSKYILTPPNVHMNFSQNQVQMRHRTTEAYQIDKTPNLNIITDWETKINLENVDFKIPLLPLPLEIASRHVKIASINHLLFPIILSTTKAKVINQLIMTKIIIISKK